VDSNYRFGTLTFDPTGSGPFKTGEIIGAPLQKPLTREQLSAMVLKDGFFFCAARIRNVCSWARN
jgi:hypothetical protein